jgi:hypothetical protein
MIPFHLRMQLNFQIKKRKIPANQKGKRPQLAPELQKERRASKH